MGTNTFHLLIAEVNTAGFSVVYSDKVAVKIGEKGINNGFITPEAQLRVLTTLTGFKSKILEFGATKTFATATSAIRNARNSLDLIDKIQEETGISTRIINGKEEAAFIYHGVNKAMDIGDKPVLIMDIGGGSIEFIIGNREEILWLDSFEIGGQRLVEMFHKSDPIQSTEILQVEQYLEKNLEPLFQACAQFLPTGLIGSSGTFDTLSEIYQWKKGIKPVPDHSELPFDLIDFDEIYGDVIHKNREERLKIPGMIPLRVDMIVVALILVKLIIQRVDIPFLRISAYALKEGVLLKTLETFSKTIS